MPGPVADYRGVGPTIKSSDDSMPRMAKSFAALAWKRGKKIEDIIDPGGTTPLNKIDKKTILYKTTNKESEKNHREHEQEKKARKYKQYSSSEHWRLIELKKIGLHNIFDDYFRKLPKTVLRKVNDTPALDKCLRQEPTDFNSLYDRYSIPDPVKSKELESTLDVAHELETKLLSIQQVATRGDGSEFGKGGSTSGRLAVSFQQRATILQIAAENGRIRRRHKVWMGSPRGRRYAEYTLF
ncbi:hypothetical protein BJ742DRAFT_870745 [Cladochytrium replicatum]|nr:hypothetical protein BJ742DRAFT_870745 [Cladochytrium replicatum]